MFYRYFELHVTLCCVLGLKDMSVNLMENVLVILILKVIVNGILKLNYKNLPAMNIKTKVYNEL